MISGAQSVASGKVKRTAPAYPLNPLAKIIATDMVGTSNRSAPSVGINTPSQNIFQMSSGYIPGTTVSTTATQAYAAGPAGNTTALRLQFTSGSGRYDLFQALTIATDWTLQFKATSTAGAGAQTFRYGNFVGTMSVGNVTEGSWTTFAITIPAGSNRYPSFVHNSTAGDILVDEVQLYEGSSAPAYVDPRGGHAFPERAITNAFTYTSGAIDTSSTAAKASIIPVNFPSATTFAAFTWWAVIETTDTSVSLSKVIGTTQTAGACEIGNHIGSAYGLPAYPNAASSNVRELIIASRGKHLLVGTGEAGFQGFYFDGIPQIQNTNTLTSFNRTALGFLGDPPPIGITSTWGALGFKGKTYAAGVLNRRITAKEVADLYRRVKYDFGLLPINHMTMEGDSITATTGGNLNWSHQYNNAKSNLYIRNSAVSSTSLTSANGTMTRHSEICARIRQGADLGHNMLFAMLHGANGIPTLQQLYDCFDPIRNAGASQVFLGESTHKVGDAAFNTNADTYNTTIVNHASKRWLVLPFSAAALTETVGVDYADVIHPNTTGCTKMYNQCPAVIDPYLTCT
jgi:hypothetical protein